MNIDAEHARHVAEHVFKPRAALPSWEPLVQEAQRLALEARRAAKRRGRAARRRAIRRGIR